MAIDMTVSNQINSKKSGYSGVQKHTEHDPNINHSNINLDVDRLQFNYYENTAERKQALMDWQADHTMLDIEVLNEKNKLERPWLTVVLDDFRTRKK